MRLYNFYFENIDGTNFDVENLAGKKVLIVNTASACGYTPQFGQLQELYENTDRSKFEIIGFPSNDFGAQDPGSNKEIAQFCQKNYGVTFPIMSKTQVKGANAHPLYAWMKSETGEEPKWNFHKYIIDPNGNVLRSLESGVSPLDPEIMDWING